MRERTISIRIWLSLDGRKAIVCCCKRFCCRIFWKRVIAGRIGRNVLLVVTLSSTFFLSFCEFRFYSTRGVIFLTLVARMLLPSVRFFFVLSLCRATWNGISFIKLFYGIRITLRETSYRNFGIYTASHFLNLKSWIMQKRKRVSRER